MATAIGKQIKRTVSLQFFGRGISAISGIVFARVLGPEEYGFYSFLISTLAILGLVIVIALPQLIVREVAKLREADRARLFGFLCWSKKVIYIMMLFLLCMVYLITQVFGFAFYSSELLLYALPILFLRGMTLRNVSIANGFERTELSQLPIVVINPLITLLFVCALNLSGVVVRAEHLVGIVIFSFVISYLVSVITVSGLFTKSDINLECSKQENWNKNLLPFILLALVVTVNTELPIIFLGAMGSGEAVAFLKVSLQVMIFFSLGTQAINAVIRPKISRSYAKNDIKAVQSTLNSCFKSNLLFTLPVFLVLMIFKDNIISVAFGELYVPMSNVLSVVLIGGVINSLMGSMNITLNMTGHEREFIKSQVLSIAINLILLFVLVPKFGLIGAAWAMTISVFSLNILSMSYVYKKTGLKVLSVK